MKGDRQPPMPTGREIRLRIEHALRLRSAPEDTVLASIERSVKPRAARAWRVVEKRPSIGVLVVAGLALVAAEAIGAAELAFAVGAGYAAYQVIAKGRPLPEAVRDGAQIATQE
jgi:hypothetical protein